MASSITKSEVDEKRQLADFIKSVHENLRKQVRKANGDFHSVWQEHRGNSALLQQYSQAMKELATEHWGRNNLKRIEWCKDVCVEYFYKGGREKCLWKVCKRVLLNLDQHWDCNCQSEAESMQLQLSRDNFQVKSDKIVLLDVGSCFNPFQAFPDIFTPLAIDLYPADKSVFSCDFLLLDIIEEDISTSPCSSKQSYFPEWIQHCITDDNKITKLPQNAFDMVVFCLLLSYFPAKEQRWTCILKAYQLLKSDGILIIITPDSSHQNKNMAMIKSWKIAIESTGFLRWKYWKDSHTHCMAFRKKSISGCKNTEETVICPQEMMYIHQDLEENYEEENNGSKCNEDACSIAEGFDALPFA